MKHLTRLTLITVLAGLLFPHCSKSKDVAVTNYLKGKMDGVAFECNANIYANTPQPIPGTGTGDDPTINITGDWPSYSIHLHLNDGGASITARTYVFEIGKDINAIVWQNNTDSYEAGSFNCFACPPQLYGSGKITILEISKNYIKGSFEFVTEVNSITSQSRTFSDGEFYIKRS